MSDNLQAKITHARVILSTAIATYRPKRIFLLFSGGHDSLCATHVAATALEGQVDGVAHIDTTCGIPETTEFVHQTAARERWNLKKYTPPVSYEEIVLKHGFPGPGGHVFMYSRLKERCIRQLVREHKAERRDLTMLVTGVRRQESTRRMGHVVEAFKEPGTTRVWVAPIIEWDGEDKNRYLAECGLQRNEVVDNLCMSGECGCGSFARPGELDEIRRWYPAQARRLEDLQAKCKAAGVHCVWGTRPPRGRAAPSSMAKLPMCHSCEAKREEVQP